jgi:hypothetical protein
MIIQNRKNENKEEIQRRKKKGVKESRERVE